jgi:hypothetical protein
VKDAGIPVLAAVFGAVSSSFGGAPAGSTTVVVADSAVLYTQIEN